MSLQETFNKRLASKTNQQLLGNLGVLVGLYADPQNPMPPVSVQDAKIARLLQRHSGAPMPGCCINGRSIAELLRPYDIDSEDLVAFASGGVVVDHGAGESRFLDTFSGSSKTIALDQDPRGYEAQKDAGHQAELVAPDSFGSIKNGSVRLLHASYSAPYYSIGNEARIMVDNVANVLEPGGIALVGATLHDAVLSDYEALLRKVRCGDTPENIWRIGLPAIHTLSDVLFAAAALHRYRYGDLEIVGHRRPADGLPNAGHEQADALPNFLMLRRPA